MGSGEVIGAGGANGVVPHPPQSLIPSSGSTTPQLNWLRRRGQSPYSFIFQGPGGAPAAWIPE